MSTMQGVYKELAKGGDDSHMEDMSEAALPHKHQVGKECCHQNLQVQILDGQDTQDTAYLPTGATHWILSSGRGAGWGCRGQELLLRRKNLHYVHGEIQNQVRVWERGVEKHQQEIVGLVFHQLCESQLSTPADAALWQKHATLPSLVSVKSTFGSKIPHLSQLSQRFVSGL